MELQPPKKIKDTSRIFDTEDPLVRLQKIEDNEFELIVGEWAYSCLKESKNYTNVVLLGGAGDAGRDVVAYLDSSKQKFDIYQCKHYNRPLSPSTYMIEFGKLCYYTYIHEYNIPQNYYIVSNQPIGPALRKLIEHPNQINKKLIEEWDEKCGKKGKINSEGISLSKELKEYIEHFDFSIVSDISPIKLMEDFKSTVWFKYHFGGGLKRRPPFEKPKESIMDVEKTMPYVSQLLQIYSKEEDKVIHNPEELKAVSKQFFRHFLRQREGYFSAQSLKRFVRDELFDEESYENIKGQIEYGIMDVYDEIYNSEFNRLKETVRCAQCLPVTCNEIRETTVQDRVGMCHELVNDGKIRWSEENEDL